MDPQVNQQSSKKPDKKSSLASKAKPSKSKLDDGSTKAAASAPAAKTRNSSFARLRPVLLIALCLLAGFTGALIQNGLGSFPTKLVEERKSLLVKEDSAVIDVAKQVSPSVVSITSSANAIDIFGQSQTQASAGTGIIIRSDGLILTNKHVVEGGDSFSVITSDGKEYKNAKVVAKDPSNDIAFLRVDAKGLTAAKLGDSSTVQVGQRVVAIGNALGQFQNTVTTGVISGKSRPITASGGSTTEDLQNLFQTDAAINPGNSGGPLVNIAGEVIGINTAVAGEGAQNIGFAIPINEAKKDVDTVSSSGKIVRAYLGVRYTTVTQDIATRNDLSSNTVGGAYIGGGNTNGVVPGSPADKAGLKDSDVIIKLNNTNLDQNNSLSTVINTFSVGETVKVTYLRDGKEKTVSVKLGEAPSQ